MSARGKYKEYLFMKNLSISESAADFADRIVRPESLESAGTSPGNCPLGLRTEPSRKSRPAQERIQTGLMYERQKKKRGGTGANQHSRRQAAANTAAKVAAERGVSVRTVLRAAEFVSLICALKEIDPGACEKAESGKLSLSAAAKAAAALKARDLEKARTILFGQPPIETFFARLF